MKRFGQFTLIMMLFLIVAYLVPIYSEPKSNQKEVTNTVKQEASLPKHKAFPYGKLAATGFAKFVDQKPSELTKLYGEPLDIQANNFGGQWWILGDEAHDYLQIEVKENRIKSIFVLGEELGITPFELGMSLTDVAALTTIYSNFDMTYHKKEYSIELTEDDMNYRPLVAFDNGTFAILHFNQKNGKLMGIRYLDKEMLLHWTPYQVEGTAAKIEKSQLEVEQAHIDKNNQLQLQSLLTVLDPTKGKKIHYTPTLMTLANVTLKNFLNEKSDIFQDPVVEKEWDNRQEIRDVSDLQVLNGTEMSRLLEFSSLNPKIVTGTLVAPSSDIPFLVMTLYGTGIFEKNIVDKNSKEIGVACAEGVTLFLVSTKTTVGKQHPEDLLKLKKTETTDTTMPRVEQTEETTATSDLTGASSPSDMTNEVKTIWSTPTSASEVGESEVSGASVNNTEAVEAVEELTDTNSWEKMPVKTDESLNDVGNLDISGQETNSQQLKSAEPTVSSKEQEIPPIVNESSTYIVEEPSNEIAR